MAYRDDGSMTPIVENFNTNMWAGMTTLQNTLSLLDPVADAQTRKYETGKAIYESLKNSSAYWKNMASENYAMMLQQNDLAGSNFWGKQRELAIKMSQDLDSAAASGYANFKAGYVISKSFKAMTNSGQLLGAGMFIGQMVNEAQTAIETGYYNGLGETAFQNAFGMGFTTLITSSITFGISFFGITGIAALGLTVGGVGLGVWAAAYLGEQLWNNGIGDFYNNILVPEYKKWGAAISDHVNTTFTAGQNWRPRDPLTFDLDGDGIETLPLDGQNSVLFDHNADGVKTATGWVSPDDGFLVRDLDGNGLIDTGRELFGDNTLLSDGTLAANGFEALADLDANADGVIDANDAAFAELRIWQDANSDGITQSGELLTLNQAGIASINTDFESANISQDGNTISGLGSYTRTDGTLSSLGSTTSLGNLDLAASTFYSEFTDPVTLTPEAEALPTMQGSGMVRDMREAASIDTNFATALTSYSALTTREEQLAAVDDLLLKWSETSGLPTMIDRALEARFIPEFRFGRMQSTADIDIFVSENQGQNVGDAYNLFALFNDMQDPEYMRNINMLTVLERFNGREFIEFVTPDIIPEVTISVQDQNDPSVLVNYYRTQIFISGARMSLLEQSYQALRDSVYDALLPQTRLKPYLEAISVAVDAGGNVSLDFTDMEAAFTTEINASAINGITDLVDLMEMKSQSLNDAGWKSWEYLGNTLTTVTNTPDVVARLRELNIIYAGYEGTTEVTGSDQDDTIIGSDVDDILLGGAGDDFIYGGNGVDTITGGRGRDRLYGGAGNDVLGSKSGADYTGFVRDYETGMLWGNEYTGGVGDDILNGNQYSDVYYFNAGDGRDTIDESGGYISYADQIVLGAGIVQTDVTLTREDTDLLINFSNNADQIRVQGWYLNPVSGTDNRIEALMFSDGTVWDVNILEYGGLEVHGTDNGDTLTGLDYKDDRLYGEGGNDTIGGGYGRDQFYGGAGNDVLGSKSGADYTGFVRDYETGMLWGNEYTGGVGDDILNGNQYSDVYYFNAGDGRDTIDESGGYISYADQIVLGAGIVQTDVTLTREDADLLINFSNDADQIRVKEWYASNNNRIESLLFADGTVWDVNMLHNIGTEYNGTDGVDELVGDSGNNTLRGGNSNDVLDGGAGIDRYWGEAGDDVLGSKTSDDFTSSYYNALASLNVGNEYIGGMGNDTLNGSQAADSYYFNTGDGMDTINEVGGISGEAYTDTIKLGAGIAESDVTLTRENNSTDLLINFSNGMDQIRIKDWYGSDNNRVEYLQFSDNTMWDVNTLAYGGLEVRGTDIADVLNGLNEQDDRLYGENGDDVLFGYSGNDQLYGGGGIDTLVGFSGMDMLYGENGNDYLNGLEGNDILDGGAGSDKLYGAAGNDILGSKSGADFYGYTVVGDKVLGNEYWGGLGADILNGSLLGDIYYFNSGDGMDTIDETSGLSFEPYADKIVLGADISEADVRLTRENNTTDLLINFANGTDQIRISQWYANDNSRVESLEFADGVTVWDVNTLAYGGLEVHGNDGIDILNGLNDQDDRLYGEDGNDVLFGYGGNDQLYGGNGTDTLVGFAGMDRLYGGNGDDYLNGLEGNDVLDGGAGYDRYFGGAGNDTLGSKDNLDYYGFTTIDGRVVGNDYTGGTGDDTLNGTYFADTYYFNIGDGADTIDEINGSPSEVLADNLVMGAGINSLDLIFRQNGNDLDIQRANSQDRVTVTDWYSDVNNQVETVSLNDGAELLNTQVDLMIQAMATFSADNGGISWEQAIADRPDDVQAVIAAYWQPAA